MHFRILGSLEVEAGAIRLPSGAPGEQKVLAVLLLNANHAVPVSRLVDALWDGEPPPTAGDTQHAVGDHSAARGTWQHALGILTELQHPDAQQVEDKLAGRCSP